MKDAQPGCVRQCLFAAAFVLFRFEAGIRFRRLLLGMMDGAFGLGADLPQFSLVQTIGNDSLGGVLARLELGPFCLFRGVRLLRPNLDVLAASDDLAAFLPLAVGRADLYKFRLRGNLLLDVRFQLGRIAIGSEHNLH